MNSDSLENALARRTVSEYPAIFNAIHKRYAPRLLRYLVRLVKEETLAEDLLQDSFIKIWNGLSQYDSQEGKLINWLFRIVRNTAISHLRSQHMKRQELDSHVLKLLPSIPPIYIGLGLMEVLPTLLEAKYWRVVELIYGQDYTMKEAAQQLGIPVGTVKTRIRYVLNKIRIILEQEQLRKKKIL